MSKNSIEPRRGMCGGGETTRNLITTRNPPLDVKGKETPEKLTLSSFILRHKLVNNTYSRARLI